MKAVLDANVLYPVTLRSLLLDLALLGVYQPYWTEEIQDEWQRNLLQNRPELSPERLQRTREQMEKALPDALIHVGAEGLAAVQLPDPNDAHVLAAALWVGAQLIVTANLRDFPLAVLTAYGVEAISPDAFLCRVLDTNTEKVRLALIRQHERYKNPPVTLEDLLHQLAVQGVPEFVRQYRRRNG